MSGFVSADEKRMRAQFVLAAMTDRDLKETAAALVKLVEGFGKLDFQQLEDAIPDEVWDGLVLAMADYRRRELTGQ